MSTEWERIAVKKVYFVDGGITLNTREVLYLQNFQPNGMQHWTPNIEDAILLSNPLEFGLTEHTSKGKERGLDYHYEQSFVLISLKSQDV